MAAQISLSPELLAEIRQLVFQTRRLAEQGLAGAYRSAFRGHGIEFDELREYFPGDDIRSIDWKVTARSRRPFVKRYHEERELTVIIAVDISSSTRTGTGKNLRASLIAKAAALLALIALKNNDNVGLLTYSDRPETFHPPRKARSAVWRILHEVMSPRFGTAGTDLAGLANFLSKVVKRRAVVFLLSDFIDRNFEHNLAVLAKRHDVTAIRVTDSVDQFPPFSSLVDLTDPETGAEVVVDFGSRRVREAYQAEANRREAALHEFFLKTEIGFIELNQEISIMNVFRRYFFERRKHLYR